MPSVRVKPQSPGNTHDISLSGSGETWGIKLGQGARSIQEISATPSNIRITQGGQKFGDFDPSFSHIEMRDWSNGRAREYYVDDPAAFFDGTAWTLTEGQWHQPPMWGWGAGDNYNSAIMMPGNFGANEVSFLQADGLRVDFKPLLSTTHYARKVYSTLSSVHSTFATSAQSPSYINLVARRFGNPPNLNVNLYAGGASRPDSSNLTDSDTISATNIEEYLVGTPRNDSIFITPPSFTSAASSAWVEIFTTVASRLGNHWEIGYTSQSLSTVDVPSTVWAAEGDGTSGGWSTGRTYFYLRMFNRPPPRKLHFFEMQRALYAVAAYSAGDRPEIYINGDRGIASSNSVAGTLITATQEYAWDWNQWLGIGNGNEANGARIAIVAGTGAGQSRGINSATTGSSASSVAVSPNWDIVPTSDSEWVIYNTHRWRLLSTALLSSIAGSTQVRLNSVTVADNVAYFGFGNSTAIGRLTWNSSIHQSARNTTAGSSIADVLQTFHGSTAGTQVWRAISSAATVSYATAQNLSTELTFGGNIPVGDASFQFTNLEPYDGVMYAFKEDSVWSIVQSSNSSGSATKLEFGSKAFTSTNTGRAVLSQNLHLYFSLSHSLERFYRSGSANEGTVDDIGPWKLAGLPRGRNGPISALAPIIGWTVGGVDPSTGNPGAVLLWNDRGWHEIFRASTGLDVDRTMIQNLHFQSNPGGNPRLWIDMGGQIMQIPFPKDTLNPLNDEGNTFFWPEGHIITPTIDMGITQLPKLFHEISVISRDLGLQRPVADSSRAREIRAEYQIDEDVGSTNWTSLEPFVISPEDTSPINRGDKKQIRFRFRALTNHTQYPTRVDAMVLKSVARTPIKRQWNVRAELSAFSVNKQGLPDAKPDDLYLWLQDAAASAKPLNMHAAWKAMDNVHVFIEQPTILREFTTPDGSWGAVVNLTLREI